jgi:hypothetical protein
MKYGFTVANQTEVKIENSLIVNVIDRINYLKIANPEKKLVPELMTQTSSDCLLIDTNKMTVMMINSILQ